MELPDAGAGDGGLTSTAGMLGMAVAGLGAAAAGLAEVSKRILPASRD